MRVYIAGPMTGKKFYNVDEFQFAAYRWRAHGHTAHLPFYANSRVWHRHYGRTFNPYVDKCDYGDPLLPEMIIEDLIELRQTDAIALLPGWENSKGTKAEILMALTFRKPIYDAVTMERMCLTAEVVVSGWYSQDHITGAA